MNELKYIIVESIGILKNQRAILFNGMINHIEMVPNSGYWVPVSAGFCTINDALFDIKVYGESISLNNLKSRPEDAEIIMKTLNKLHSSFN